MRLHPAPIRLLASVLMAGLLLAGAGCSDDGGSEADATTTTAASSDPAAGGSVVVAQGSAFANDLTLAPGAEFALDNQDSASHTLTADDGAFDSGTVEGGSQSDPMAAPDAAGAYDFHCEIHSSMTGTITVE